MLEELSELIEFIQKEYNELTNNWEKSKYYKKYNLKNNQVCDLLENKSLLVTIVNYREFINQNNVELLMNFKRYNTENATVNTRTKAKNSIEFKMENYIKNHENGKVSVNKCFNDLFGIRIICNEVLLYDDILKLVNEKRYNLKCIDSTKDVGYKATHIYFKKDNYSFQWELQIWNKEDEKNNIKSHEKYKQEYVKWEKENKGGNKQ